DLGEGVRGAVHAVADLVVEPGVVAAGLERDAHVPQLFLVPLEHAVEGLVRGALGVLRHGLADLLLEEELPGREQADHEVEQPLRLVRGHEGTTYRVAVTFPRPSRARSPPGSRRLTEASACGDHAASGARVSGR